MKNYLILDIETTGFSPIDNEILEIGLLYISDKKIEAYSQINTCAKGVPPHIVKLTGITEEMMRTEGIHPKINLAFTVDNYIRHADIIIGHNFINFDLPFLNHSLKKIGQEIKQGIVYDTMRREVTGVNNKNYSLPDLAKKYKVVQPTHRAKMDCITTLGVYIKQNVVVPDVLKEYYKTLVAQYHN